MLSMMCYQSAKSCAISDHSALLVTVLFLLVFLLASLYAFVL